MAAHQRRRHARASAKGTLPTELLLEIVARSDAAATLFRCAAACKLLRREIASPEFVRRICESPGGVMPPWLLGFLLDTGFSLVHPSTTAAASFAENHLALFMSRVADDLLSRYEAVTSRGGLVLLERGEMDWNQGSERASDMCVYDPMTGERTFFPLPPDIDEDNRDGFFCNYVLLTEAADGIGCSFLLLAVDLDGVGDEGDLDGVWDDDGSDDGYISVRTLSSDTAGCQWSAASLAAKPGPSCAAPLSEEGYNSPVVLGGVVHFLMGGYVLTYDVGTATTGMIELPKDCDVGHHRHLGSTREGNLRLFGPIYGFRISFWVMSGDSWSQRVDIETLDTLRSLLEPSKEKEDLMAEEEGEVPDNEWDEDDEDDAEAFFQRYGDHVKVESIGDHRSGVVLPRMQNIQFLLDMDTTEICRIENDRKLLGVPYVVDLSSRLSTMKMF